MESKDRPLDQNAVIRENIRNLRISRRWNVLQVADQTGIPVEALIEIEEGADCRLEYLGKLCDLFELSMIDMFQPVKVFRIGP